MKGSMKASQTNQQNISNAQGKRGHIDSLRMYFAYRECPKLFTYLETKASAKTVKKKALRTQGFEFLSVRKKVRPSAGS